jgi:hypothetical protein
MTPAAVADIAATAAGVIIADTGAATADTAAIAAAGSPIASAILKGSAAGIDDLSPIVSRSASPHLRWPAT